MAVAGTPPIKKRPVLRFFLLSLLLSALAVSAAAYGWVNSLVDDLHSNKTTIAETKKFLSNSRYGDSMNILLIGTDHRFDGETGRSDTIMVMNVNFERNRVYLVSIPRDTRTYIPGVGTDKINAAYAYGGPRKTVEAVKQYTGVKLHHYVEIDFKGFAKIVDALGGVDVPVAETINNKTPGFRMYIPKGTQRMSGELALNYVRYRHGDSDFKRAERQQNFIKSLAGNVARWQAFWKIPRVIGIVASNTETDMSRSDLFALGNFLRGEAGRRVETATLIGRTGMAGGVSYVFPNYELNQVIFETMARGGSLAPIVKDGVAGAGQSGSSVRVTVLNGSGISGLASAASRKLQRRGFKVVAVGNASSYNHQRTQVIYRAGFYSKGVKVRDTVFPGAELTTGADMPSGDVVVILGKNYLSYKGSTD